MAAGTHTVGKAVLVCVLMLVTLLGPGCTTKQTQSTTLTVAVNTEHQTMDAHRSPDTVTDSVLQHISETLFRYSPTEGVVPHLVKEWSVSKDGTVWRMVLRPGVIFHDGTPLNSDAVIFNLKRVKELKTPFSWLLDPVVDMSKEDELTFKIVTKEPYAPFLSNLCHGSLAIQSPKAIEEQGENYGNPPVGTGPFRFVEWVRGQRLVLERFDKYWGKAPAYDRLVFVPVREDATRVAMLETGTVDVAMRIPADDVARLSATGKAYVMNTPTFRRIFIGFNVLKEPVKDVLVRRALFHAIDRESIVRNILKSAGQVMTGPLPENVWGYYRTGLYEYDPDRARQLLAEAGYPNGFDLVLYHPTGRYAEDTRIAQAIADYWGKVGVRTTLQTFDWATYLAFLSKRPEEARHTVFMLGASAVTGDADLGIRSTTHSANWAPAGNNRTYYKNERVDELLDLARAELDPERRLQLYTEAQQIMNNDVPYIYLHVENMLTGVRVGVEGVEPHPAEMVNVTGAVIKK